MIEPLINLSSSVSKNIIGIFFDIDDTFSLNSKILPEAYQALWDLKTAGLKLIPITGRPAGWCDHIARMWPVDGVVGENGAFFFWCDKTSGKFSTLFYDTREIREKKRQKLNIIKEEILMGVPGAGVASDQNYREADLAIDFCEDVPALEWTEIEKICKVFEKYDATYKISSIHVNGWFGQYNKLDMTKKMVSMQWGIDLDDHKSQYAFCGDSPNDEPMFEYFPISIGVNNVRNFEEKLVNKPKFITKGEGGIGFAQFAKHLLKNK